MTTTRVLPVPKPAVTFKYVVGRGYKPAAEADALAAAGFTVFDYHATGKGSK